ncbi:hypothetical protein QBC32DRAFT_141579 [Pseudoneurospora amorphoporcata]|uniref:Secreted protein n=1 Tax=Pseudoneurospora amorphoporcata TaxID=241081 RepID=A0AAN6NIT1_9PEZI|nr:hypothetical protein QBC32DRAFT_141579 [Pseudoneurospora amorphoporcata]
MIKNCAQRFLTKKMSCLCCLFLSVKSCCPSSSPCSSCSPRQEESYIHASRFSSLLPWLRTRIPYSTIAKHEAVPRPKLGGVATAPQSTGQQATGYDDVNRLE